MLHYQAWLEKGFAQKVDKVILKFLGQKLKGKFSGFIWFVARIIFKNGSHELYLLYL